MAAGAQAVHRSHPRRNIDHLTANLGALNVALTTADLQELDSDFAKMTVHGARMDEANMRIVE